MSTATDTDVAEAVADAIDEAATAAEVAVESSHRLLKFLILVAIGAVIFAVVKQLTADSEPEPYETRP
jgi:heme A synthase